MNIDRLIIEVSFRDVKSKSLVVPHASQGGHWLALNLQKKKVYIHLLKKILYTKLAYCDNPNKNVEYPNLRITKNWVQQK